jgi:hypothetical protein
MALLAASALAIFVGVAILGLLLARLWMKVVWRVVMIVLSVGAVAALGAVIWLWIGR